ncbi:hypothetical protein [Leekyejoonella antrihumi]|uniref:Uncharacterized protein n=1 Tax=Leekyejoonella antrihumi TaxID=1660198 RepID=A0A563E4J1_9MICO|nr:hypothetical protein [Leekyejoonella antrihumi]TWP36794.1 hypothetical protein FGL98_08520 [Leekyejoonella antrihumi]
MTAVPRWMGHRPLDLAELADLAARGQRPGPLIQGALGGPARLHVSERAVTGEGSVGTCATGGARTGHRTAAPPVADSACSALRRRRLSDALLRLVGARRLA